METFHATVQRAIKHGQKYNFTKEEIRLRVSAVLTFHITSDYQITKTN